MAYGLSHSYFGANFISDFNFINYVDPSNGFVRYQSQPDALAKGLYSINPATQAVTLGVDNTNVYGLNEGRPSLRLESKRQYNHGLFIGDFAHMPPSLSRGESACVEACRLTRWGTVWMYGPDWPRNGEVDIIEGANQVTKNIISGHTIARLEMTPETARQDAASQTHHKPPASLFSATARVQVPSTSSLTRQTDEQQRRLQLPAPASHPHTYGDSFNAVGGGVYALEWTSEAIRIWHWPRQSIPRDIIAKRPDPATWGLPSALFGTSTCEVDRYFKDMSIVIQTNFCGDYAANIWGKEGDTCNQRAPTCVEYVANNPGAFRNAGADDDDDDQDHVHNLYDGAEPCHPRDDHHAERHRARLHHHHQPGGTDGHRPPSPSTDPIVPDRDPATIGEYTYLGCYGSATGFQTFLLRASVADLTPQKCVDLCRPGKYAAVRDNQCFCAEVLDPDTRAEADRGRCSIPCPGNNTQLCGGTTNVSPAPSRLMQLHRRAAPANYLLTVYGRISDEVPPPAPPLGDPEPHAPSTSTLVTTITYTTVYATDAASLVPAEHRTTILVPGCNKYCGDGGPAAISVPLVTTVASCGGCGEDGANEVTLTVPLQVAAVPLTASATGYWPAGGQTTPAPPGAPTPSLVTVSAAADVNLAWAVGLGVAIAVVRSALMFF
ncbi:endo-1,3(4)-beta-glucanase [Colletotrichum tofieldiae]|nr:endo-1,3(4)-beta-glucanase [Colletotrichum tofieldiae]